MNNRIFNILSIGNIYLDINGRGFSNGVLEPENEIRGKDYDFAIGGSAFNFVQALSSLGLKPSFLGKVGKDYAANILSQLFEKSGIKSVLVSSSDVKTNIGMNLTTKNGKTLMAVMGSANQSLKANEVRKKIINLIEKNKCNALYLGGVFKLTQLIPVYLELINKYKANLTVFIDHGRVAPNTDKKTIKQVKKIVSLSDYYFPSQKELLTTWDAANVKQAIEKIRKRSKTTIVIKLAEKGCMVSSQDKPIRYIKGFKVDVYNPVGAGDTFNAGFVYALEKNLNIIDAAQFANATAALKISQNNFPKKKEINIFLKKKDSCS